VLPALAGTVRHYLAAQRPCHGERLDLIVGAEALAHLIAPQERRKTPCPTAAVENLLAALLAGRATAAIVSWTSHQGARTRRQVSPTSADHLDDTGRLESRLDAWIAARPTAQTTRGGNKEWQPP
jgi:hypothetical protein